MNSKFETSSFKRHLRYLLNLMRDEATLRFGYTEKKQKIFSSLFMLSLDGEKFNWFMLKDQRDLIFSEVITDIAELDRDKIGEKMLEKFIKQALTFDFQKSGMISYFNSLDCGTDIIPKVSDETYLTGPGYNIDYKQPDEFTTLYEKNEKLISLINQSIADPDLKIENPIDVFKYLEKKWAFSDEKESIPYSYFMIYPFNEDVNHSEINNNIKIVSVIPLFSSLTATEDNSQKNKLTSFIDFARSATKGALSLRKEINKESKKVLSYSLRSAISAIMSRNGSHNIGSHVINRVIESIDSLNIQDHKYLFRYLQQRMDFVAQISTDFSQWSSSHWFVKEIMKGFYEQRHLLHYIAKSEGLDGFDVNEGSCTPGTGTVTCTIRSIDSYQCNQLRDACNPPVTSCSQCDRPDKKINPIIIVGKEAYSPPELSNDLSVSIPGGLVGFHAFYTIIENFIRNSAKHCYANHPDRKENHMEVAIEIWDYEKDNEYYTVTIRDNYSFISGNVNKNTDKVNGKELDKQKIRIYTSGDTKITLTGEGEEIVFIDIAQINKDKPTKNNLLELGKSTIAFVVDDGKRFRTTPVYKDLSSRDDVRFIEGAYWKKFYADIKEEPIDKSRIYTFLERYYTPAHIKINKTIMKSLINEDGSLRRSNWGIGEMKITAGYLKGCDISEIGGSGKENLKNIIKAVAIPEKDENEKIKAYRLGYEFRMKKPVDINIIDYDEYGSEIAIEAKKYSITFSKSSDPHTGRGEIIVIYDPDPVGENALNSGEEDNFMRLIRDLSAGITSSKKSVDLMNKIKNKIEEYNQYRLFLVSNNAQIKELITNNTFLNKRLALISSEEFKHKFPVSSDSSSFDNFKIWLRNSWVIHVKENIRKIHDDIDLIFKPFSHNNDHVGATKELDEKSLEIAFRQTLNALDITITNKKFREYIDFAKKKDENNPYGFLRGWYAQKIDDRPLRDQFIKYFICAYEKIMMEEVKEWLQKDFGIYEKNFHPSTSPILDPEEQDNSKIVLPLVDTKINLNKEQVDSNIAIRYERHKRCPLKPSCLLYCEDLSGAAAHYPQLSHMPKDDVQRTEFACRLLENGLLRIGIADERIFESAVQKKRGYDELTAAGIVFFYKIGDVSAGEPPDELILSNCLEIKIENGQVEIAGNNVCDIIVLHQGILDKIEPSTLEKVGGLDGFILSLKEKIPFVVVTSGRGRPHPNELPEGVKFLPFSILEASIMAMPHSKFNLIKQLL